MIQFVVNIIISVMITALGIMIANDWNRRKKGREKDRIKDQIRDMLDSGEIVIEKVKS